MDVHCINIRKNIILIYILLASIFLPQRKHLGYTAPGDMMTTASEATLTASVEPFLDLDTETWSYVVYDEPGRYAAIIDPVLDFDPKSGRTSTGGAERLVAFIRANHLTL